MKDCRTGKEIQKYTSFFFRKFTQMVISYTNNGLLLYKYHHDMTEILLKAALNTINLPLLQIS